jgi:hypothetical protein
VSLAVLTAVVASLTLYFAWPRLQASLLFLPVDTAISNFNDSGQIPFGQLDGLQQRATEAISVYPHYRYWDGLSLLYYLEGLDRDKLLFDRRQALEQSIQAARNALSRAPSQPQAWYRIANASSWLRYPVREVIDALSMAVYTGRVDPSLFMARLELGFRYLQHMDDEEVSLMRDQALLAWQLLPRELSGALQSGNLPAESLEYLLAPAHGEVLFEIMESIGGAAR